MLAWIKQKFSSSALPRVARLAGSEGQFAVAPQHTLLQAALESGIDFPHHCTVGTCGTCRCRLVQGDVRSILDFSYTLSAAELEAGYILACQALLKTDIVIEAPLGQVPTHPLEDYRGTVTSLRRLSRDIIALRITLDRPLLYTAGQFAELTLPGLERQRSYSFAAPVLPGGSRDIEFHVRHVSGGAFTDWLFAADRRGETIPVRGPNGAFWLRAADAPLLCVAGGTGMAPLLAVLEDALQRGVMRPVTYLYGARTAQDLYAEDRLEALARAWPTTFNFIPVLSEEPGGSAWDGRRDW